MNRRGQAAVETALTMPLVVFLLLGTIQLFSLLQGRIFAEHAAFSAVRSGMVRHGDCLAMTHSAIAAALPNFTTFLGSATPGSTAADQYVQALRLRTVDQPDNNRFYAPLDGGHDRPVVWIFRESPKIADVDADSEDDFDDVTTEGYRLEVRLIYWFPLRIPFANWVMATIYRAYFGFGEFSGVNPLLVTARAHWTSEGAQTLSEFKEEFNARYSRKQYSFPIPASAVARMMTPPRSRYFQTQNCAPAP